jgi:DNA-binding response OmpR family regulator
MERQVNSGTYVRPSTQVAGIKILLVEDDFAVADVLTTLLESEGYRVTHASHASDVAVVMDDSPPDLIILDIMLPDADGLVLCGEFRARWSCPIILLSATQRRRDTILGLRLGADDFIAKPFDARELLARIETILRRSRGVKPSTGPQATVFGPLSVDTTRRMVTHEERPLQLTPTEFALISALASDPSRIFSREELGQAIWGEKQLGDSRVIDVHVRRLRQKLDEEGVQDPIIATFRGFGYRLCRASVAATAGMTY